MTGPAWQPATIADACEMVRTRDRLPGKVLCPRGGGTKPWASALPNAIPLDTRQLCRVVEFSPADMTITVEAGMTLTALDAILLPVGLRLPVDPPAHTGRATVGGVLAANDAGPLRYALGAAREHVIGMSMVLADGTHIKSGGRVVKNVAGYDLHRLFVGSCGSLGLITTATFKLRPRSACLRIVTLQARSVENAEQATAAVMYGATRPAFIEWIRQPQQPKARQDADRKRQGGVAVYIAYEDDPAALEWQLQHVADSLNEPTHGDSLRIHEFQASHALYGQLRDRAVLTAPWQFQLVVPPEKLAEAMARMSPESQLQAHAGNGVIHGASVSSIASSLTNVCADLGGWARQWGAQGATTWHRAASPVVAGLEHGVKRALDPTGMFAAMPV